jgi:hypothetical protein
VLLLVTIALVLVAAVALVIGFVSNQLPPIYLSIVCSFVAAVVLAFFSRLNRRRVSPAGGHGPAPLVDESPPAAYQRSSAAPAARAIPIHEDDEEEEVEEEYAPTAHDTRVLTPVIEDRTVAPLRPATPTPPPRGPVPATPVPAGRYPEDEEEEEGWDDEPIFPIEDYDLLRVAEILPLLRELDPDELEEVRDREEAGRSRATILNRIDQLLGQGEAFTDEVPISRRPAEASAPPPIPPPPPIPEPAPIMAEAPEPVFPIADYDELRVAQILPLLSQLDPDELEEVGDWERQRANRRSILSRIDRLLGNTGSASAQTASAQTASGPTASGPTASGPTASGQPAAGQPSTAPAGRAAAAAKSTAGKRAAARTAGVASAGAAAAAAAKESPSRPSATKAGSARTAPGKSAPARPAGARSTGRTTKAAPPTIDDAAVDDLDRQGAADSGVADSGVADSGDADSGDAAPSAPAGPRSLPRRPARAPIDPDQPSD